MENKGMPEREEVTVCGKKCVIRQTGSAERIYLWAYHDFSGDEFDGLLSKLRKVPEAEDCVIAAFEISDWDAELSPWEAPQAFGTRPFAGKGPETLRWLLEGYLPYLKKRFPEAESFYTMGYSLAGLFALWALYETDQFAGCVCCSGSLWIDGWDAYAASHGLKRESYVYLSLGGKEEKTENPLMKRVGDRTREQERLLSEDPNAGGSILFWNRGGHFADASERLSRGILWMQGQKRFIISGKAEL